MAYLKRPQRGEKVLQSLFDSVNSIIDYLPSITVRGDNFSTYVEHSTAGTVIHAKQPLDTDQSGKGKTYEAGSGLTLSGNTFNVSIDPNTMAIVNNRLSCTIEGGSGGSGTDHKYCDNGCHSLMIAPQADQINGWNYIGVNPDWLAGNINGGCTEGYYAIMSAILKALSGTNQSTPFAIGSQSVQTMGTQIWVNPYWLAGYTSCSAGFYGICSAVYRYLSALPVVDNGDTLKKGGQMGYYWGVDQQGSGGGGGGDDTVYAYYDYTGSIIFNSNNPSPASDPSANAIYINVDWLAGNTQCQAGYDAICSAIYKYLTGVSVYDSTSCTLKIDPTTSGIYWAPDNVTTIIPSTGLTSTALTDENNVTTGIAISISAVNDDKVLSCHNGTISWQTNNAGGGPGPGDGDHVYKYGCADTSIYFNTNDAAEYTTPETSIDQNYIGVNANWLAGNGVCQAGFDAVCSAINKYLTGISTYDTTSCTLKINPTTNTVYWAQDIGANQNFLISTGLTSATVTDPDTGTTIGTSVALNNTYISDLNVITGHSNSTNHNKVLSCNSYGAIGWVTNNAGGGGGGSDENDWYKYAPMNASLIFDPASSNKNGTTYISFNSDWLAGNGVGCCCYEGPAAVASAIIKILTEPVFDGAAQAIISALKNNHWWNSY